MDEATVRALWSETLGADAEWTALSGEATYRPLAEEPPALPAPEDGSFVPGGELGRGGVGIVYRARQTVLDRDVALKVPLGTDRSDEPFAGGGGFLTEALFNGRLEHPNIVPVHDLGRGPDGGLFLAMKLVEGETWKQRLEARPDALDEHLEILLQVCNAVAYAHSRGVVHNDLKPGNVMLGRYGEVLLTDWGLAVELEEPARLRHRSAVRRPCGTPGYMPPELAEGDGASIGPETDTYLLGGILFRILSGRSPHSGATFVQTVVQAVTGRVGSLPAGVPDELRALCLRALDRDPARRFPTAEAFQAELRAYLRHRESLLLSAAAQRELDASLARGPRDDALAGALSAFGQALRLWQENPRARAGRQLARRAWARLAIERGDLALATAQLEGLREDGGEDAALRDELAAAERKRERERRARKRLRLSLAAAALLVAALLGGQAVVRWSARSEALTTRDRMLATQRAAVAELPGESLRAVLRLRLEAAPPAVGERPFPASVTERQQRAATVRRFHDFIARRVRLADLSSAPVAGELVTLLAPDSLAALRAQNRADLELAAGVALRDGSFDLAETLLAGHPGPESVRETWERRLADGRRALVGWQLARTEAALDDLHAGRGRAGRPDWWPTPEEYVIELSAFREEAVVATLAQYLEPALERAALFSRRAEPIVWTQNERELLMVILRVLGRLQLPGSVPVLCDFLATVWDPELVTAAGLALCDSGDPRGESFLVHQLRHRFGINSEVWQGIARYLARIRTTYPSAESLQTVEECQTLGLLLGVKGDLEGALAAYRRGLALDSLEVSLHNDLGALLYRYGRHEEAAGRLSRAIALAPERPASYRNRAMSRLALGMTAEALEDFDRAIELAPLDAGAFDGRGQLWLHLDSLDLAIEDFAQACALDPSQVASFNNLSIAYANTGRHAEAVAMATRAIELDPRDGWLYFNRGRSYLLMDEARQAVEDFDAALRLLPDEEAVLLERGSAHLRLEQPAQALADFDRALALGGSAVAHGGRGAALLRLGRREESWQALRRSYTLGQRGPHIHTQLAALFETRGELDSAAAYLDRAIVEDPQFATAWLLRGQLRVKRGEDASALADLDRGVALAPHDPLGLELRGALLVGLDRCAEGLANLDRALALAGETARLREVHARALYGLGRFAEARAGFQRTRQLGASSAELFLLLAQSCAAEGDLRAAADHCTKALHIFGENPDLYAQRAAVATALGDLALAEADCDACLAGDPTNGEIFELRAGLRFERGAFVEAEADLARAFVLLPEGSRPHVLRGMVHWKQGRHDAARADLDRAVALRPTDPAARLGRAEHAVVEGRVEDAGRDLELARELAPDDGEIFCLSGVVAEMSGDGEAARRWYDRALALDPRQAEALRGRALLALRAGELARAEADLDQLIAQTDDPDNLAVRGRIRLRRGRPEDAIADFDRCLEADPDNLPARAGRAHAQAQIGQLEAARDGFLHCLEQGYETADVQSGLGYVLMVLDQPAEAYVCYARGEKLGGRGVLSYNAACMLGRLDAQQADPAQRAAQRDRAFAHLAVALERGWDDRELSASDSDLAFLHDDPRWEPWLEKVGE